MVIAIRKRKKSSKANRENWENISRAPGPQFTNSFESNTAKFSQSRHGSSAWNVFLRCISKLSCIWHFSICKLRIRKENCHDTRPIRCRAFPSSQCKQLMNMREIIMPECVKIFSNLARYFKTAAVGLCTCTCIYGVHAIKHSKVRRCRWESCCYLIETRFPVNYLWQQYDILSQQACWWNHRHSIFIVLVVPE